MTIDCRIKYRGCTLAAPRYHSDFDHITKNGFFIQGNPDYEVSHCARESMTAGHPLGDGGGLSLYGDSIVVPLNAEGSDMLTLG